MPITDPLVLAADVAITPVKQLSPRLRARLKAKIGDYAVSRERGRTAAKLVSRPGARLLEEFRDAKPVSQAVLGYAGRHGLDPKALLAEAFPLLRDCFNSRFLVPADSPDAARILATRERGDRIGRFEVLRCLQVLEDTELYQARAEREMVAIKIARPGARRETRLALSREAAVLLHLGGKGVPRLVRRGSRAGRPYIALSWSEGVAPDVAFRELRERGDADAHRRMLELGSRIARGYSRLHAAGIVHGDVHPHNMLIGRRGNVTLLDFGLARPMPPLRLAGRAGLGGVGYYFSPEQAAELIQSRDLPSPSASGEQYAVAAVLYFLVTGSHYTDFVLDRDSMLQQIMHDAPMLFSRRGRAPWPELETVLARALAKNECDRFPSMAAFARAIERVGPANAPGSRPRPGNRPGLEVLVETFLQRVDFASPAFETAGPPPTASLMLGRTGIAYALYRLACGRDDPRILTLADAWITRIEQDTGTETAFTAPGTDLVPEALGPVTPFHSIPGVHLVRALIALAMSNDYTATRAIADFIESSRVAWSNLDLTLGRSGSLLAATRLLESLPPAMTQSAGDLRALGRETLLSVWAETARFGPIGRACEFTNFAAAHGWAGILYTTLGWCRVTNDPLPPSLHRRLGELAASAEPLGRGTSWPQQDQVAGWCNGPSGFIQLWTLAHATFRREEYLALAESCGWSTWEIQNQVFDLCCGLVGRAYGLLNLYRHTGRSEWLERSHVLAGQAARQFSARRSSLEHGSSLFKGEAGLALLIQDLTQPEMAAMPLLEPEGFPPPHFHD